MRTEKTNDITNSILDNSCAAEEDDSSENLDEICTQDAKYKAEELGIRFISKVLFLKLP